MLASYPHVRGTRPVRGGLLYGRLTRVRKFSPLVMQCDLPSFVCRHPWNEAEDYRHITLRCGADHNADTPDWTNFFSHRNPLHDVARHLLPLHHRILRRAHRGSRIEQNHMPQDQLIKKMPQRRQMQLLGRFGSHQLPPAVSKLSPIKAEKSERRNRATPFTRPASSLGARRLDGAVSDVATLTRLVYCPAGGSERSSALHRALGKTEPPPQTV